MKLKSLLLAFISFVFSMAVKAQIYDGVTQAQVDLNTVIDQVKPGTVLVVGENHGLQPIHDEQMSVLQALHGRGFKVSVGMEFFNYTDQALVQQFRAGVLSEADFEAAIKWSGYDFHLYSPQLLFPDSVNDEVGLGINMPRSVTGQISQGGLTSLSADQLALMPPSFQLGDDNYRRRFAEAMGTHPGDMSIENFFVAQCTWDDTMAWQSLNYMQDHQDQVFVIIVGEFHVGYGGGVPNRLRARIKDLGLNLTVKTISQVYTDGMSADDIQAAIAPSAVDGVRADYVFLAAPVAPAPLK